MRVVAVHSKCSLVLRSHIGYFAAVGVVAVGAAEVVENGKTGNRKHLLAAAGWTGAVVALGSPVAPDLAALDAQLSFAFVPAAFASGAQWSIEAGEAVEL